MEFQREKKESNFIKITIKEDDQIIGRASIYLIFNNFHKRPYGFIEDVFINDEFRGKGIGTKLIEELKKEAEKNNCYKLILDLENENLGAQRLYTRLGFVEIGKKMRFNF